MEYALFASAACVLFFACAQLAMRNKQPFHYTLVVGLFGAAYTYLYFWAVRTGLILRLPALVHSDISAAFVFIPAVYLSALTILHNGRRPVRSYTVYFIAPVVFAVGFGIYNALTAPAQIRALGAIPQRFRSPGLTFLTLLAVLAFAGALALDLLAALRLKRSGQVQDRSGFRHQVTFLFLYFGAALDLVVSSLLRSEHLYVFATLVFCPIILAFAVTRIVIAYFGVARTPPNRSRPVRPEWEDSAEELTKRLDGLMRNVAPYRDENLTLPGLARMLGVEPRRLSYHLHRNLSTNFRTYINGWRLESVRRDLLEHPDRPILQAALESGFNSKSTFNTLFRKKFGKTPRQFRGGQGGTSG